MPKSILMMIIIIDKYNYKHIYIEQHRANIQKTKMLALKILCQFLQQTLKIKSTSNRKNCNNHYKFLVIKKG